MTLHDAPAASSSPSPTPPDLPTTSPRLVDPPDRLVVMIDGVGSPESPRFAAAVRRLYAAVAGADAPLEGLWSQAGQPGFDLSSAQDQWRWTLLLPVGPDTDVTRLPQGVRAETFTEGRSAEVLHVGPSEDEEPTIAKLSSFITDDCGLAVGAPHHEIYLDDPKSCPPDRLRTVIRFPVH